MRQWLPFVIIIPIIEIFLLYLSGKYIGFLPTLLIVIATGVIGFRLAKSQGIMILVKIREDLSLGRIPGDRVLEGFLVLMGGVFLLFPGYLTDLAGFLLLIPLVRRKLTNVLRRWIMHQLKKGNFIFTFRR